jgi:hypothetical protein
MMLTRPKEPKSLTAFEPEYLEAYGLVEEMIPPFEEIILVLGS